MQSVYLVVKALLKSKIQLKIFKTMKQKITLLIFMALASVFTFDQNTVQKQS